jgi:biotin carboxyl carrier protein
MSDPTYRALVGDRSFDVVFEDGRLLLDGQPVAYTFDQVADGYYTLLLDGKSFPVLLEADADGRVRVHLAGRQIEVQVKDERALLLERFGLQRTGTAAQRTVRAPMPGLVLRVIAEPGQAVRKGDGLLVLEAMKMENELRAQADGVVKAVHVTPGDAVGKNALLLEFEA